VEHKQWQGRRDAGRGVDTTAADGLAEVRAVGSSVCVANFHSAWVLRGCMFHWCCDVRGRLGRRLIRVCGIGKIQLTRSILGIVG
jgi:hypothetical protein